MRDRARVGSPGDQGAGLGERLVGLVVERRVAGLADTLEQCGTEIAVGTAIVGVRLQSRAQLVDPLLRAVARSRATARASLAAGEAVGAGGRLDSGLGSVLAVGAGLGLRWAVGCVVGLTLGLVVWVGAAVPPHAATTPMTRTAAASRRITPPANPRPNAVAQYLRASPHPGSVPAPRSRHRAAGPHRGRAHDRHECGRLGWPTGHERADRPDVPASALGTPMPAVRRRADLPGPSRRDAQGSVSGRSNSGFRSRTSAAVEAGSERNGRTRSTTR